MAGIYIHIPFCKQACVYCDFHFSTVMKSKSDFVTAITKEIELQKSYLQGKTIETVYFGGGTPSLLSISELNTIFKALHRNFNLDKVKEITLEANPDDLSKSKINELINIGINRLSIGVQSFCDTDLQYMQRAHTANEALRSIKNAQNAGITNISIDLIYGTPTTSHQNWYKNLKMMEQLNVPHFSAYALTVEKKTALHHFIKQQKTKAPSDKMISEQFIILLDFIKNSDYEQYEISNFCRADSYSKHNSGYWLKKNYLGLGPSAHSFNGMSRQWNVSNNTTYIKSLQKKELNFVFEKLSLNDQYNEYLMTALRTKWGVSLHVIESQFGSELKKYFTEQIAKPLSTGWVIKTNNTFILSTEGKLLSDGIIADLFIIKK